MIQAGIYRHYKGKLYLVLGTARHSETGEIMVVYVPLYELPASNMGVQMAVRPLQMFTEGVEIRMRNGSKMAVPRFEPMGDGPQSRIAGGYTPFRGPQAETLGGPKDGSQIGRDDTLLELHERDPEGPFTT